VGARGKGREEFRAFFDAEFKPLVGLAYRLTGNVTEAEDLAQEAMVRTYRAWKRIRDRERPAVYARAVLLNRHRSRLRQSMVAAKSLVLRHETRDLDADPSERLAVWDALMKLPIRQREAIVLHYYEDLPQNEIAAIM